MVKWNSSIVPVRVFCKTWWYSSIVPVSKPSVRHGDIRPSSQWESSVRHGDIRPSTEDSHRDDGRISFHHVLQKIYSLGRWTNITMSFRRLTHWDDGRISPCLTEDFLTGTMDECHHVLQKTYSLGRWTNVTMSYRRLTYSNPSE
jgi:hypothetical protein